jgi:hypothetical protein
MNRRKSHADENFTWTGFRFRQFSYGEDVVGVAGAFKDKCFHFGCLRILWDVTAAYERGLPREGQNMRWRATSRSITTLKISLHKSNIEQQHCPILCQPPAGLDLS